MANLYNGAEEGINWQSYYGFVPFLRLTMKFTELLHKPALLFHISFSHDGLLFS